MIDRFLMLFSRFRDMAIAQAGLQADYRDAQAEVSRLQRQLVIVEKRAADSEARASESEARYLQAVEARATALEKVADFHTQLRFGRKIFDAAPELPPAEIDYTKMQQGKRWAGDLAREKTIDFFKKQQQEYLKNKQGS